MACHAACFSNQPEKFHHVFSRGRLEQLTALCQLHPRVVTQDMLAQELPSLSQVEVIFSSWGMFPLSGQELDRLPKLNVVFYAAGATEYFSAPFLSRGITVVSAWPTACWMNSAAGCKENRCVIRS